MAIAFDAFTESGVATAGSHSWTHTPSGTPRGVIVLITQTKLAGADDVTGVTYGGVTMTRVDFAEDTATEEEQAWSYFLGSSIPTGNQTVAVTVAATATALRCLCITVTAAADTAVEASGVAEEDQANPTIALSTGVGVETFCCGAISSGQNSPLNLAPGSGMTELLEYDFGDTSTNFVRKTDIATGGSVNVLWTATSDDVAAVALAVKESAAAGLGIPIAAYHYRHHLGV